MVSRLTGLALMSQISRPRFALLSACTQQLGQQPATISRGWSLLPPFTGDPVQGKKVRCGRTRALELVTWYVWVLEAAVHSMLAAARAQYLATWLFQYANELPQVVGSQRNIPSLEIK